MLFYGFFVAVAAGMAIIQDDEWRLSELLHATPLRPDEYIWGKFAAVLAGCAVILVVHLTAMVVLQPSGPCRERRGVSRALHRS